MTDPIPSTLPAGPYVIRNRETSTVLHIPHPDAIDQGTISVQARQQDEGEFKDQQIWWIEPLAKHNTDPDKGTLYSITSPGSGKALEGNPDSGWVYSNQHSGGPWQRWILTKVKDPNTNNPCYNIVNFLNDKVLDIHGTHPQPGAWVTIQPFSPDRSHNRWEFVIPVVGFPPGWFHMQNVRTGHLLSHDYGHNPPVLLPPPNSPVQSQNRRDWQFQWTLCHFKCFKFSMDSERNAWYIINRLTRAPLSPHFTMEEKDFGTREDDLAWKLELDSACNWRITNRNTSCLLQLTDTLRSAGGEVGCSDGTFTRAGGRQSWILRPPLLHSGHGAVSLPSNNLPLQRLPQPRTLRQHLNHSKLDARTFSGRLAPLVLSCRDSSVRTVQSSHLLKTTLGLLRSRFRR